MEGLTTKSAFEELISKRAWYEPLNINFNTANGMAKRYREGKLSIEKIEEVLIKSGAKVKQEKLWLM